MNVGDTEYRISVVAIAALIAVVLLALRFAWPHLDEIGLWVWWMGVSLAIDVARAL